MFPTCLLLGVLGLTGDDDPPPAVARAVSFERDVRPILERSCFACHGPEKQRGGLRLDRKADALRGGGLGQAILPGRSAESPLIHYVAGTDPDLVMPPQGDRLSREEVGVLRAWVDRGADWPDAGEATGPDATWWSFRPLVRPEVPSVPAADQGWARNPIDAFIAAKRRARGLGPAPEADRRALARRLSFDLLGLPPTPEEVAAFLADPAPDAYERLVDRLLASPGHGERWARHWLDVVHYGDTHGYDKDKPRPNAWPYRDYVIRALNADKPYGRFIQEQIAGDALFPGTRDGVEALGFLAAGPWDFIGHAEVPESKVDGKVARHLDRDDMVATTINTFLSLTVQCAQCHDHKFDPITQEDYYRLQAVMAAIDRADKTYHEDPATETRARSLDRLERRLKVEESRLLARAAQRGGDELAALDRDLAAAEKAAKAPRRPEFGYHSALEKTPDHEKWVQLDLGVSRAIQRVVVIGCHDDFNQIGDGFGFPQRFHVAISDDPTFERATRVLDRTNADQPNPGVRPLTIEVGASARYVRFTATKLALRQDDFMFALAEVSALDDAGQDQAKTATVTARDAIEAPPRWRKSNLVDGVFPAGPSGAVDELRARRRDALARLVDAETREALEETREALEKVAVERAALPKPSLVYAGTVHRGTGAFAGTAARGGQPRPIHVLTRGDVRRPGREVGPGAIASVRGPAPIDLPGEHDEGDRRAALARWTSDRENPLTWRSIVNRVWHYHMGRGIVATPSDFGRMGQSPSHPELLDWLAVEFRDGGGSLKDLHRLIVTSATYRQSTRPTAEALTVDADNALVSRMSRRKLDAESVRDSVLAVSGRLGPTMYGAAFQDFVVEKPEHSPHYQYHLFDAADSSTHRRSIYRFLVRSQQQPFMTALDCADPSMQVDRRNETLSAPQALALLNNDFMLVMARHFAGRVAAEANDTPGWVRAMFARALGREPSEVEVARVGDLADRFGLANACRLMFNLNEFVFVE